jgi:two-component SAPR family response regulator
MKIVIVHENRISSAKLGNFLENAGHEIEAITIHPRSGLNFATLKNAEVIVLSISVGGAPRIAEEMRYRSDGGIIVISYSIEMSEEAMMVSAEGYLTEPFEKNRTSSVMRVLEGIYEATPFKFVRPPRTLEIHSLKKKVS